jgi:tetratricopeptide (TPR) repeat protein
MPKRVSRIGTVAIAVCLAALACTSFAAGQSTAPPASTTPPSTRPPSSTKGSKSKAPQRIPVTIHATPEEREAEALAQLTANAFGGEKETNCQKIIETYETDLLPAAEKAKFPNKKANFVAIAHKAIGDCQTQQGRYIEADSSYRQALAQIKIWPGIDDQRHVNVLNELSVVQMRQDRWKDAESTATDTAAFHQRRIDDYTLAMARESGETADNIRKAKEDEQRERSASLTELAYLYQKDGDLDRAASTVEQAYDEAVAGKLPAPLVQVISGLGAHVADLRENRDDIAKVGGARGYVRSFAGGRWRAEKITPSHAN